MRDSTSTRNSEARVEFDTDPQNPGRRVYRISGASREAVQAAITRRINYAEERGGRADFIGPSRILSGWGALGETVVPVAEVAA